jgi:hypothetical protein
MSDVVAFGWIVAGVFAGVLLPYLANIIRQEFPTTAGLGIPPWIKRYFLLFVFGVIVGGVTLAIYRAQNPTGELAWYTAFLIGYGWQATLEKFGRPKP